MKKIILFLFILNILYSIDYKVIYHGLGLELTENGVGLYYQPEIISYFNIYTKMNLHFERSNLIEINPYFNTQNPGFNKTLGLLSLGGRIPLLKDYFYNEIKGLFLFRFHFIKKLL